MIPLSKATVQMSKYVRDDQKQEWYDNEPIPIYAASIKKLLMKSGTNVNGVR